MKANKKTLHRIKTVCICTLLTVAALLSQSRCEAANVAEDVTEPSPMEQPSEPNKMMAFYDVPLDFEFQSFIIQLCEEHHIDPAVVIAMIDTESGFNADAIGDSGNSYGLMQIQQRFHLARMDKLGVTNLRDPYQNVTVGVDYLHELLEYYGGNIDKALIAYNAGQVGAYNYYFSQGIFSNHYSQKVLGKIENLTEGMIFVYYSNNPHADFDAWDAEQNKQLEQLPVCADCGEHIQDEEAYHIHGEWICINCMDCYRKEVLPE